MPTPQENSLFVEQASCLFIKMIRFGKMPNPYSPQENSLFVEQASCLFIKMIRPAWKKVSTAFLAVALTLLEH
jgi:hypothetical protein